MPYCTTPELPDFDIEFEEDYMDEILALDPENDEDDEDIEYFTPDYDYDRDHDPDYYTSDSDIHWVH